jgi:hypothetical protein
LARGTAGHQIEAVGECLEVDISDVSLDQGPVSHRSRTRFLIQTNGLAAVGVTLDDGCWVKSGTMKTQTEATSTREQLKRFHSPKNTSNGQQVSRDHAFHTPKLREHPILHGGEFFCF